MSSASPQTWSELTVCPSCGAAVANEAKSCWLCKWNLAEEIVTAEIVSRPPAYSSDATKTGLIAGVIILGVVTVGVFAVAPGIGVLMGILFVIAAFAVGKSMKSGGPTAATTGAIEQAYASPSAIASANRVSVIADVFKVLGIIALIGLASIIAFFTFCVVCVIVLSNA